MVTSDPPAAYLFAAADRVPFAGPGLPPLVLHGFRCQCRFHLKARGRLSERTLGRSGYNLRMHEQGAYANPGRSPATTLSAVACFDILGFRQEIRAAYAE